MGKFQDLKFYDQPNKNVTFFITTQIIDKFYSNFLSQKKKDFDLETEGSNYAFVFYLNLRNCTVGEIFRSDAKMFFIFFIEIKFKKRCKVCDSGEYSLIDGMKAINCLRCPPFSESCYKNIINVRNGNFTISFKCHFKIGFWRSSTSSITIYSCGEFSEQCW